MDIEQFAEELHRQYRAAEKAMNRVTTVIRGGRRLKNANRLLHDHSFYCCGQKKYFRERARLIFKRAEMEHPSCLMEHEQKLLANVLSKRIEMGL
jgi:hypothetical protein